MKKIIFKGIWFTILLILMTLSTNAQSIRYAHIPQEQREKASLELMDEAEYVVEGKSKGYRYFYGDDGKTIYTEYTFEVSHWYKGKGEKTIFLVRKGGYIGGDYQIDKHERRASLSGVSNYVILLKASAKQDTYNFLKESRVTLAESTDISYLAGFYGMVFKHLDDFNQFTSKAKDIKIPH